MCAWLTAAFSNCRHYEPSCVLAPDFEDGTLEAICDDFNDSQIAIAFNSYDPKNARETVYLNPRAQDLLNRRAPLIRELLSLSPKTLLIARDTIQSRAMRSSHAPRSHSSIISPRISICSRKVFEDACDAFDEYVARRQDIQTGTDLEQAQQCLERLDHLDQQVHDLMNIVERLRDALNVQTTS